MNPEIKTKWLAALRSGTYKQGKGALCLDGAYCCLGVLCDIVDPEGWQTPVLKDALSRRHFGQFTIPSKDIRLACGLLTPECAQLATENDAGKSFAELALWIEDHL